MRSMMKMSKSYSELIQLSTFDERLKYLCQNSIVGETKFGHSRYLNQSFYHSTEWKRCRRKIILRDMGCDMGLKDHPIYGRIIVHHINEVTIDDLERDLRDKLFDPENLICVSNETHQLITYGLQNYRPSIMIERQPNDTCPWR